MKFRKVLILNNSTFSVLQLCGLWHCSCANCIAIWLTMFYILMILTYSLGESREMAQLPHSYYFTTRILVLKFENKGVFFEEIQDSYFPTKRGYFGTRLLEFGEKGVFFMSSVLPWKGDSFGLKSQCFTAKKGFILDWKAVFYREKGVVLSWKVSVLPQKRGSFSNWKTGIGTIFSSEWGSRGK